MTVLPSQKLTIGELFVSLAAGLMLFLLPNDAKNQFESPISESFITVVTLVITFTLYFIIKRFEAIGAAMLTSSILNLISIGFTIFGNVLSGADNWLPKITEYNIISMFIIWTLPFFCMTALRLVMSGAQDTNERRMGFSRFLVLSMRALLIAYAIIIVFKMVLPYKPSIDTLRYIELMPFARINDCITNIHQNGAEYIIWHSLILVPFSFYLLVLIPRLSWVQIIIVSFSFGITIEILQYSFNTGTACVDDIIMYMVGAVLGLLLKHLIDKTRSVLTMGQDNCMLSTIYE